MNWISPSSLLVSPQIPHKHTHVCAHTYIHALRLSSLFHLHFLHAISAAQTHICKENALPNLYSLFFSIKELYMSIPIILQQLFKHQFSIFLHSWISIRYPIEEEKKKIFDRILNISRNKLIQFLKNKNHIWFSPSVPNQCSVFDIYFFE